MYIKVINPNTTASMTAKIEECARAVAGPDTFVEAVSPSMGPTSIESHVDEALSIPGILEQVVLGETQGVDGYVIACFGDPGMDAAREVASGPVVGIAEAAMHTASFLGRGFSVVTTLERTTGRALDLAAHYGMSSRCRGVHACRIPVLELETDANARKVITETCREALLRDGSDAIVLGCAGMADLCEDIQNAIGVPVVDGVTAATLFVQSLVAMGLRPSKSGEFAPPPPKPYAGLLAIFGTEVSPRLRHNH
ncbi:Asp/Glu racemase [Rhodococcus sp. 1163]|uniref:aspartate/glutamate racemase family protein n=1 Tax=unclassified Rhodococcus (in: high G+C Gram-positive bacteria) TaxID=192944 RepID=UPI000A01C234|nr:aspartate/glutamate racemase family protein [Rhodococcus sp. 1163]ORI13946.1 Asp/Glu racemase [Rhodococcus sp. 1163]